MSFVALKTFQTDYNIVFLTTRDGVILKRIIKIDNWCKSMKLQKFGLIHLFIKIHLFIHSLIYTLNRSCFSISQGNNIIININQYYICFILHFVVELYHDACKVFKTLLPKSTLISCVCIPFSM